MNHSQNFTRVTSTTLCSELQIQGRLDLLCFAQRKRAKACGASNAHFVPRPNFFKFQQTKGHRSHNDTPLSWRCCFLRHRFSFNPVKFFPARCDSWSHFSTVVFFVRRLALIFLLPPLLQPPALSFSLSRWFSTMYDSFVRPPCPRLTFSVARPPAEVSLPSTSEAPSASIQ